MLSPSGTAIAYNETTIRSLFDYMNQQLLIGAAVGLIVGGLVGYFFGSAQAANSINKQIAEQERSSAEASVNPFENVSTNPLENVKTNPYEGVKTNPFE